MKQSFYKIKSISSLFPHWGLGGFLLCLFPLWLSAQTPGKNYIVSTVPFQSVTDPTALVDANSNTAIQYFDGLGRPIQTVQRGMTPSGADLVTGIMYDSFGRDSLKWLPAVAGGNNGAYYPNFAAQAVSSNGDDKPYSRTEYEPSPLNRVTGQYGAGNDWYTAGKKQKSEFTINGSTNVKNYGITDNQLMVYSNYPAGSLYGQKTTDEDGKTVEVFTDKLGRKVLSRVAGNHDTYYVYDDRNNLCYVLPPLAADATSGICSESAGSPLDLYGYIYHYDGQNRCTEKKLPGCGWIYMVYDKADRLILSQDGNQRAKSPAQWTVNKYDSLGRAVYTGLINSNDSRATMESNYSGGVTLETYTGSGPVAGYTSGNLTPTTLLTVNYYDSYGFVSALPTAIKTGLTYTDMDGYDKPYPQSPPSGDLGGLIAKGLLTGTRVYHLDNTSLYETTALYYDKYGRVVQSRASNHLGGYDLVYNALDFTGKPTKTLKTHNIAGQASVTELYTYVYDKAQRPKVTTYQLNGGAVITQEDNTYDDLGRLIAKARHSNADTESHTYNVRSWPTNNTSGSFQENLFYNAGLPSGVTPSYNGNIAMNTWTYNGAVKKYGYAYDALNRMTNSTLYDANNQSSTTFGETFTFDKMGNVTNLGRTGSSTQIDGLTLTYNGNQLKQVDDASGSRDLYDIKEYTNRNTSGDDFAYDANGNMVKDLDRNIVAIQYNVLNLPDIIQFRNGNQIKNTYDADGHKLGTEYFTQLTNITPLADGQIISQSYNSGVVDQTGNAYIGNMEYNTLHGNASLTAISRIYNDEGYVENPSNPQYYYYRRDHLGDNREVWLANTGETLQRTQYYPSGLPWAYNSGDNPGKQQRKYNGKEFVEMHGYDTYDIVWRQYYPAIMRFQTQDPFAEKYYNLSPYTMCADNMVRYTDPDGRQFPIAIPFTPATGTPIGAIATLAYIEAQLEPYIFAATVYGVANVVAKVQNTTNNQSTSQTSQAKTNSSQTTSSNYSHLPDTKNTGDGKKTTRSQRQKILEENKKQNNGELKSDGDGRKLDPPSKNMKGQKANMNQAEVDHINPRSKGGSNNNSNLRVISKEENLAKGNR